MSNLCVPAEVLARAAASTTAIGAAIGARTGRVVDAGELIGGRAALLGLPSPGRTSAGGASRLMQGPDGWCALTLSRADDLDAVPALIESAATPPQPWPAIERYVAARGAEHTVTRARLLGLPVGMLGEQSCAAVAVRRCGTRGAAPDTLLVVDLTSMWAGPLCTRLLADAGATVVKVESPHRPDGTRQGPAAFFDWMNAGKLSYTVDFDDTVRVRRLLLAADVVVESSRPAALQRRGLGASGVPGRPGRVWVRITGHGTDGERGHRVAFGDDAAVSGGLVGATPDGPVFCGDAIADPLTGIGAALAVRDALSRGGGEQIDLSMAGVAAEYARSCSLDADSGAEADPASTTGRTPPVPHRGPDLGADNEFVERLVADRLAVAC